MPSSFALEATQNETFRLRLEAHIGTKTGELENLTGCTARMMIRENWEDTSANIELTTENGGITLGGVEGTIDVLITLEQMLTSFPVPAIADAPAGTKIPFAVYVYDLQIIYPSGDTKVFLRGTFTVFAGVTHDD